LDAASVAIKEAFGAERHVQAVLWSGQPAFRVNHLFMTVAGTPSSDDDWERLVQTYEAFNAYLDAMAEAIPDDVDSDSEASARRKEIDRVRRSFHIVLSPEGETGPMVQDAVGSWL
jgi:hypothetical protein